MKQRNKRNTGALIGLLALLILLLIGSGLVAFFLYWHQGNAAATNRIVGHAFFVSSGQLNEGNSQGNNDELQIELQNVPAPAPGEKYYAWLLSDASRSPMTFISLGALPVNHGSVDFRYPGDQQHTNLIAVTSRLLITEESAAVVPKQPSSDRSTWRYYAELPQQPAALASLRALLGGGTSLQSLGIQGGLNIQQLKNTAKVLEWVYSARDSWDSKDTGFIHRQIVRALDYLDGVGAVQADVPPGTPLLVDASLAQVPLLASVPNQIPDSYPHLINNQLARLLSAPGVTDDMRTLATQSQQALSQNVQPGLMRVRQDARQLVQMTDAQLVQPSALLLLDDMVAAANFVFVGRLDPATNNVQPGVVQIFYNIQRLATYDVTVYKG
jgi:hypothetical protein